MTVTASNESVVLTAVTGRCDAHEYSFSASDCDGNVGACVAVLGQSPDTLKSGARVFNVGSDACRR